MLSKVPMALIYIIQALVIIFVVAENLLKPRRPKTLESRRPKVLGSRTGVR